MKVFVDQDERYPDYYLTREGWGKEVEITDKEWLDYMDVCKQYELWQRKLEALHE